ncbi:MAG TPA: cobalamin-dependent protein [Kouleothrix sp.]|nr:cobalamin-dependent protein [Kouleothrix sp.]
MEHLCVLLMQLPVPNNSATNVPLAAGYLKAYAYALGLLERVQVDMLPRALADAAGDAMLVEAIAEHAPQVLGISLYTWNSERSLAVAARAKARLPGLVVVVGGPEVQPDNAWVLQHPAVDIAVIGEGEQTFAALLQLELAQLQRGDDALRSIPGLAFRDAHGTLHITPERVPLSDLAVLPSPYLLGYLEPSPMIMVEISRWCPYACAFCLYGRNMGTQLGNRYFPLERLLAEISWGRDHGATQVHFVEANLNLVPVFRPLMRALADMNADGALALYAELRGEHLSDEAVALLCQAGLKVAEVGLQTANPVALQVAHRRTDLRKWAAGTRRLVRNGVSVYLDVILGLPADDTAGVAQTLDFIARENVGPYDVFTLQVLPGTATRQQVAEYALVYQNRPPYYILGTDRLAYAELRRLRRELKLGANLDPDEIEGCPPPHWAALQSSSDNPPYMAATAMQPISRVSFADADRFVWDGAKPDQLANHVDVVARWADAEQVASWLAAAITANPSTLFDCYMFADVAPMPSALREWRAALPFQPGYLDRVAVYRQTMPTPDYLRVSPRLWLVLPWSAQAEPADYQDSAEIIWTYDLYADEAPPLRAWAAAGGAGVWVRGRTATELAQWRAASSLQLWGR